MTTLPTLYEYYTGGGITQGLSVDQPYFTLNNKNFSLYGGSTHYFRVPSEYWRDRLRKMRAGGLNTVETYVPWNLHEPEPGKYDFGNGGTDMQEFLDIERFLRIAQEEDLFVILRPGPYICSEYEFGGLPSWLLREKGIQVRTHEEKFMTHVRRYFNVLLTLLAAFQFTKGGPIIAVQIENEYGNTGRHDPEYLEELVGLMEDNNIKELLFTSDNPIKRGSAGSLPTLFQTANLNAQPELKFDKLKELQSNKPSMATEFWSGWFNYWSEEHYVEAISKFSSIYERILKYPASANLYMFHGGTNWGFLNGATLGSKGQPSFQSIITTYDYDAPLSECGNYTTKYYVMRDLLAKYNPIATRVPDMPVFTEPKAYPTLGLQRFLPYEAVIAQAPITVSSKNLLAMEELPINNNTGQQFGYIIYRKESVTINAGSKLTIKDYVSDTLNVYVNNKLITKNVVDLNGFGYWRLEDGSVTLSLDQKLENATIDLVVCNMGRNNNGQQHFKGLWQSALLDDSEIFDWEIKPLEFKKGWSTNLDAWREWVDSEELPIGAGLYKFELMVEEKYDSFIDMSKWNKGIVIVNGFVLGRYWKIGPQQSLYLSAPLLQEGNNEIIVFEEFAPNAELVFSKDPIYFNNMTNPIL